MSTLERGHLEPMQVSGILAQSQARAHAWRHWFAWLKSPLFVCLIFALVARLWLISHAHGLMDGDEAQIGIQALHILKGEHPIYFYGQPYMGSLVAYLLAGIFAIAGVSAWTLRSESLLFSLLLVVLTWKLAGALATSAGLSSRMRTWFLTTSALVAALPPLYDAVGEMRVWGGYIETFLLSLLLLSWAFRLTQRRKQEMGMWECLVRWSGIGFVIGLGLWVDALIVIPAGVTVLWIIGWAVMPFLQRSGRSLAAGEPLMRSALQGVIPALVSIPAGLVGFAPALDWGYAHHWANLRYLLHPGANVSMPARVLQSYPDMFAQMTGVTAHAFVCDGPRVVSGIIPTIPVQPYEALHTLLHPQTGTILLYDLTLFIVSLCVVGGSGLVVLSFVKKTPFLLAMRRLLALPLLFSIGALAAYCLSDRTAKSLLDLCDENSTGRYLAILVVVIPFFVATVLTAMFMVFERTWQQPVPAPREQEPQKKDRRFLKRLLLCLPLVLLSLYLGAQSLAYLQVPGDQYFRSPFCKPALLYPNEVIAYLQKEHIHDVWASIYIGHVLSFDTHEAIIGADPAPFDRIPGYTAAVQHAPEASILFFARSTDQDPQIEKDLTKRHIAYQVARFHEEPGVDLVVVTPKNRNVKVVTFAYAYTLGPWAFGC